MFNYELVRDNYKMIKGQVSNALDANEIIQDLDSLLEVATKKGIDTAGTARLVKLAKTFS